MIKGIHHINFVVRDLSEAAAQFGRLLGVAAVVRSNTCPSAVWNWCASGWVRYGWCWSIRSIQIVFPESILLFTGRGFF